MSIALKHLRHSRRFVARHLCRSAAQGDIAKHVTVRPWLRLEASL